MPDLERFAADELIVVAPKADPTQEWAACSTVGMHEGVDLVARKRPQASYTMALAASVAMPFRQFRRPMIALNSTSASWSSVMR